jgi:hypothetical protein
VAGTSPATTRERWYVAQYDRERCSLVRSLGAFFRIMPVRACIAAPTESASCETLNCHAVVRMQHIVPQPAI